MFGEFVDEADGQLNRWESAGLLDIATELSQWNTGLRVGKNDGATSGNREHLKVSRAMNLQPFQALRLISLDLGSSGEDDGSGRNLGIPARNLLTLGFKVGSSAEAITETINEYDFQAHIDKLFRSAGSSSAGNIDGPMQDLANKLVLGAKLCSTTFPSYLTTVFSVELEAFRSRNMTLSADDGRAVTAEAEAARVARALEQRAGVGEPDSDVEDEEETVAVKRYKSIDGQKVEIDPPLSPEEQSALWKAALRRMVPARETGPALARTWNGYDVSLPLKRRRSPPFCSLSPLTPRPLLLACVTSLADLWRQAPLLKAGHGRHPQEVQGAPEQGDANDLLPRVWGLHPAHAHAGGRHRPAQHPNRLGHVEP